MDSRPWDKDCLSMNKAQKLMQPAINIQCPKECYCLMPVGRGPSFGQVTLVSKKTRHMGNCDMATTNAAEEIMRNLSKAQNPKDQIVWSEMSEPFGGPGATRRLKEERARVSGHHPWCSRRELPNPACQSGGRASASEPLGLHPPADVRKIVQNRPCGFQLLLGTYLTQKVKKVECMFLLSLSLIHSDVLT